ncbi:5-formyltetrahydrofolate cyclo-ligase [Inediibacterium massiliense]|uniref:5-formyltetrahydrofolate cyclo-ligase n=1 Tax=Inediibacterium massiliense TaxID=1658111 RepID=UPI0006B4FE73|nr:5-formyltetrahydrofolate cyclo-ligase [Inediibacterium massiliense]
MKENIRKNILKKRKDLSVEEVTQKSSEIFKHLKSLSIYNNAKNVMVYMDFRNEVKTDKIIEDLLSQNKKVILPISIKETKQLLLSELKDPQKELYVSTYGILEPKENFIREVDPKTIDLVLVPGVAFDRFGFRIGYGAGYYDRFFQRIHHPIISIGLAFDLQIIDKVPTHPLDYPLDYILTEKEIITCK